MKHTVASARHVLRTQPLQFGNPEHIALVRLLTALEQLLHQTRHLSGSHPVWCCVKCQGQGCRDIDPESELCHWCAGTGRQHISADSCDELTADDIDDWLLRVAPWCNQPADSDCESK